MKKMGLKNLLFFAVIIFFGIISLENVNALQYDCEFVPAQQCSPGYNILEVGISSWMNAHGGRNDWAPRYDDPAQGHYALCCNFPSGGNANCRIEAGIPGIYAGRVMGLTSMYNAHAIGPNINPSSSVADICWSPDLTCISTGSPSCPGDYPIDMYKLSSTTNAHIGSTNTSYPILVCCQNINEPCIETCSAQGGSIANPGEVCSGTVQCSSDLQPGQSCCIGTVCTQNFGPEICLNKVCGSYTNTCGQTYDCSSGLPNPNSKSCTVNYGTCTSSGTQSCDLVTGQWNTQCTGTTNPIPSNCAGKVCGDNLCGGTCGTCPAGNSCDINGQCVSDTSPCVVNSAGWDRVSATQGDIVYLNVVGDVDCVGDSISFVVWEEDLLSADDPVTINPANVNFAFNGSHYVATGQWLAEWQADADEPPEYYFRTTVASTSKVNESGQGSGTIRLMTVDKAGSPPACTANFCSDYTNAIDCGNNCGGNDLINAEALRTNGELCGGSCPNPNNQSYNGCGCTWDTISNSCKFTSTLLTCPTASCGDGVIDTNLGETCDGAALPFTNCAGNVDSCVGGVVSCYPPGHAQQCTLDTTSCTGCTAGGFCGDEIIQQPNSNEVREDCDGTNLNGKTCLDFGGTSAAGLSCYGNTTAQNCTFDTLGCIEDPSRNPGTNVGNCITSTSALTDCEEGNGIYTATFGGRWNWTTTFNSSTECAQAGYSDCYQDVSGDGKWHYDPTAGRAKANCETGRTKSMECPADIALPFFTPLNILITLLTIASIYGLLALERKK